MEKLLYESKGAPTKVNGYLVVAGILLPICGILLIVIANLEKKRHYISTGFSSGYIGGGHMISEDARMTFTIMGIIAILLGICFIFQLIPLANTKMQIYEKHIQGVYYLPILFVSLRKDYYYNLEQIMGVQTLNNFIILHTINGTKKIAAKDKAHASEVCQWLQYLLQPKQPS